MIKMKKAIALISAFAVISVLTILSGVTISRSVNEYYLSRQNIRSAQSFWLAEAGVQKALWELNHGNATWQGWVVNASGDQRTKTESLGVGGEYSVIITGSLGSGLTVVAQGGVPDTSIPAYILRSIEVSVDNVSQSMFNYAAFGKMSVTMTGNSESDSYDSAQGAYGGSNVGSEGDIGTNGSSIGAITLGGNATVNGDASTGLDGTVTLGGNASITGEITEDSSEDIPSVSVPPVLTALSSNGVYQVSANDSQFLGNGDYKFDEVSVSGNATLTICGDVTLYLTGSESLKISGNGKVVVSEGASLTVYADGTCLLSGNGVVNQTSLPENFLIYSTYADSGEGVKISGNGNVYGAIYAPDTTVKVSGNGDLYGALVGNDVTISGNGDVHYDEALRGVSGLEQHYAIQTWEEQGNPYKLSP